MTQSLWSRQLADKINRANNIWCRTGFAIIAGVTAAISLAILQFAVFYLLGVLP